jgi:hypothetical protein
MTQTANAGLNGRQIETLANGLLVAFTDFNDLARMVRVALDVWLHEIVDQKANFTDQVWQLVQWADAKGKVQDLFRGAVQKVPDKAQLLEAVQAVFGEIPAEQELVRVDVEAKVVETHQAVLALQQQMQRFMDQARMAEGPVLPQDSFSIREDERSAVRAFVAHFRQLPAEEQQRLPTLLNGLGKLQLGSGDFGGAQKSFAEAARCTPEAAAKAEANYNA